MSAVASTETGFEGLSAVEAAAARGELPDWSRVTPPRREHIARVARLMEEWAHGLGLPEDECLRWAAAGWLHDCLRDEDPERLRPEVASSDRDLPGPILHGPAAARRLAGQVDKRILNAVRYHTLGSPSLDRLGQALYLADFLEPGRDFAVEWRASLAARMPNDFDAVLVEVVASRLTHLIERRKPIRPETAAFWSSLVGVGR
jgi:HD superfamily phosphohydrolase YqeK